MKIQTKNNGELRLANSSEREQMRAATVGMSYTEQVKALAIVHDTVRGSIGYSGSKVHILSIAIATLASGRNIERTRIGSNMSNSNATRSQKSD